MYLAFEYNSINAAKWLVQFIQHCHAKLKTAKNISMQTTLQYLASIKTTAQSNSIALAYRGGFLCRLRKGDRMAPIINKTRCCSHHKQ